MTFPALFVDSVSVAYGKNTVLHDVKLQVSKGEIFGLIGLNGAGKTTLIKSVLGLRDQVEGDIKVFDKSPYVQESKKQIAYLPERFDPPWFLTGAEFLKFSADIYKKKLDTKMMREAAESLDLSPDVLSKKVQTYSKGMRQKLGLLATVLTGCALLILDEPMSGLDPKARRLVKDLLLSVQKEGRTIFLSSHILADMDEMCQHIGVIHNGTMYFSGTPDALKKKVSCDVLERAFMDLVEPRKAA
jgi:ABC-2 type transport system ATP-binding protein